MCLRVAVGILLDADAIPNQSVTQRIKLRSNTKLTEPKVCKAGKKIVSGSEKNNLEY